MSDQSIIIKTIVSPDKKFINNWQELWDVSHNATVFNSPEWFLTCLSVNSINNSKVIACYSDETLVGVLPLKTSKKFGITVTSVLSPYFQVDSVFLLRDYNPYLIKQLLQYLMSQENFYIHKIDDNAAYIMHDLYPKLFFPLISVNPCIPLKEKLHAEMSGKLEGRIKKVLYKNNDDLQFILHKDNLQTHLKKVLYIDQNSWKQSHNKDIFSDQQTQKFYKEVTKKCSRFVRIGILYYKKKPIAYFYGFLYGKTFSAYQTSFLNEYQYLRPGQVALYLLMENLKEQASVIDMGGGLSRYKQDFTHDYRILYDVYYSNNMFVMDWWKLINTARRIKQIVHGEKHSSDHEFLFKTLNKSGYAVSEDLLKYPQAAKATV